MSSVEAWSLCVARAAWQAEVLCAQVRLFNMDAAAAGFEKNPFKWKAADKLGHADVTFAWSWLVDGQWHRELIDVSIHDLGAHDGITVPGKLKEAYCRGRLEELVQVSEAEARDLCGVGPNLTCRWLYCKNHSHP